MQDLKSELRTAEQELQHKQTILAQCQQAVGRHKKASQAKLIEMQQAQSIVEDLQDALDEDKIEEGRLDYLKEQLSEHEETERLAEGSFQDAINARDSLKESLEALDQKMTDLEVRIKEAEARMLKAETKSTQCNHRRASALHDKNKAISALENVQRERPKLVEACQSHEETVTEFTIQASAVCDRVPIGPGETEKTLENKHAKLQRDLDRAQRK